MPTTAAAAARSAPRLRQGRPERTPEPAPPAYSRYGALRDEFSEGKMEWDIKESMETPWKTRHLSYFLISAL